MLHRLWAAAARRLALDRNPMRRRVDRVEAWLIAVTVLLLLVAAPIAGTHFAAQRQADQDASTRAAPAYPVKATVGAARSGTSQMAGPGTDRAARWTGPDGSPHRGTVVAPYRMRNGQTMTIWTNAHGYQREQPRTAAQMHADASAFGGFVAAGIILVGLGVVWAGHRLLDRHRFADWDAQWAQIAPHWMRQY